jgi:predicted DNA-binding transcriptional regulator YafY
MNVEIDYTNHRGERQIRCIKPIRLTWCKSDWHPGEQWILYAFCYERNAEREFAMAGIHRWQEVLADGQPGETK